MLGKRCSAVQTKDSGLAFLHDILKPDQEVVISDSPRLGIRRTGVAGSISGRAGRSSLSESPVGAARDALDPWNAVPSGFSGRHADAGGSPSSSSGGSPALGSAAIRGQAELAGTLPRS